MTPAPALDDEEGYRLARTSLSHPREAVAQTPGELPGSVLRVGSKKLRSIDRTPPAARDVALRGRSGTHFRELAALFLRRLCATASRGRGSEIPLIANVIWVWIFDDDVLGVSVEAFESRTEALRAAGRQRPAPADKPTG